MDTILVVMPTLDRPRLCARAVDSLRHQTHKDWNLVIAKNGGRELAPAYLKYLGKRLDDSRVRFLILPDAGLGYALNEAVRAYYRGYEYFAILEDDDEWDSHFLTVMLDAVQSTGADVANCKQRQVPYTLQSNGAPMRPGLLQQGNYINFPMCLFKTELYERVGGFSEDVGPATDWDWHLRCLKAGARYTFVPRQLVTHHWHKEGASPNYCLRVDGRPFINKKMQEGAYS